MQVKRPDVRFSTPSPQSDEFGRVAALQRSQTDGAQAERIADDADGAHAHRGARDHRVEQRTECRIEDAGRDRYRERIEYEGEEQVLPDVQPRESSEFCDGANAPGVWTGSPAAFHSG